MGASALTYLLMASGVFSAVLVALVIYGNALDTREHEEIYVNRNEERIMAGGQQGLVQKMNRLARWITVFAAISGALLLASGAVWAYIGLFES